MLVIGFLNTVSPDEFAPYVAGFLHGTKEAGFVEGQNVLIEYQRAENRYDRLPLWRWADTRKLVGTLLRESAALRHSGRKVLRVVHNTG
jgi:hypothetical protein